MNPRNTKAIATLHPDIREDVTKGVEKADLILTGFAKMIIVQSLRTFPEQDALYAQGRTKTGPKVTNARGGWSYHNFGLAIDFCLQLNGKDISWDTVKDWDGDGVPDWNEVVKVFEDLGFKWGKAFNDLPHLEKSFGYVIKTGNNKLLDKYNAKDFIPGTTYVKLK